MACRIRHPRHAVDIGDRAVYAHTRLIQALCILRTQSPGLATRFALSRTSVRSMPRVQAIIPLGRCALVDYGAVSAELTRFHQIPFQTVRAIFPHTAYR